MSKLSKYTLPLFVVLITMLLLMPSVASAMTNSPTPTLKVHDEQSEQENDEDESEDDGAYGQTQKVSEAQREALKIAAEEKQEIEKQQAEEYKEQLKDQQEMYKETQQINKQEITAIKEEMQETRKVHKEAYEEMRKNWGEISTLKKENMEAELTQQQEQNLALFKRHAAITDARLTVIFEHMYSAIDRVGEHIDQLEEDGGFSYDTQKAELAEITSRVEALEAELELFSDQYQDVESMSVEEIKSGIPEMKTKIAEVKDELKLIKDDLIQVIISVK